MSIEGNTIEVVELKKSRIAIQLARRMNVKELALEYNLSTNVMKQALIEMGFWQSRGETEDITPVVEEPQKKTKVQEVSEEYGLEIAAIIDIVTKLGLKLKEEKLKKTKGSKKYTIIDDITNLA